MDEDFYLVVKDEEGGLRPMAGIWRDNEAGRISADKYLAKNPEITIVRVQMIEIK